MGKFGYSAYRVCCIHDYRRWEIREVDGPRHQVLGVRYVRWPVTSTVKKGAAAPLSCINFQRYFSSAKTLSFSLKVETLRILADISPDFISALTPAA